MMPPKTGREVRIVSLLFTLLSVGLIAFAIFPEGPDEIYLFGPFSEREEVFLETEKNTGPIPVKLSTVAGFT